MNQQTTTTTTTTTTVAVSKNTLLFSKTEVDARFNAKNKYTDLTVPQDFAVSTNALNLSTALWQEIDMINIIANKQILGKSDWASVGVTTPIPILPVAVAPVVGLPVAKA